MTFGSCKSKASLVLGDSLNHKPGEFTTLYTQNMTDERASAEHDLSEANRTLSVLHQIKEQHAPSVLKLLIENESMKKSAEARLFCLELCSDEIDAAVKEHMAKPTVTAVELARSVLHNSKRHGGGNHIITAEGYAALRHLAEAGELPKELPQPAKTVAPVQEEAAPLFNSMRVKTDTHAVKPAAPSVTAPVVKTDPITDLVKKIAQPSVRPGPQQPKEATPEPAVQAPAQPATAEPPPLTAIEAALPNGMPRPITHLIHDVALRSQTPLSSSDIKKAVEALRGMPTNMGTVQGYLSKMKSRGLLIHEHGMFSPKAKIVKTRSMKPKTEIHA